MRNMLATIFTWVAFITNQIKISNKNSVVQVCIISLS